MILEQIKTADVAAAENGENEQEKTESKNNANAKAAEKTMPKLIIFFVFNFVYHIFTSRPHNSHFSSVDDHI